MNVVMQVKEADLIEITQYKTRKITLMRSTFAIFLFIIKSKVYNHNYLKWFKAKHLRLLSSLNY